MTARYSGIGEILKTKYEVDKFVDQLDKLIQSLFTLDLNIEKNVDSLFSLEKKDKIVLWCKEHEVAINDRVAFQKFLLTLCEEIKKLPIVQLTIAIEPTVSLVKLISEWFRLHIQEEMMLDFLVDQKIGGGVIVRYKGIYRDNSLRKKIEEMKITVTV